MSATAACALLGAAAFAPVPARGTHPAQRPEPEPAFGAFLGSGPEGIELAGKLERWLNGTEMRVGHTYLPGDRWSNIEGRTRFLAPWAEWRRAKENRMLVLNVPMLAPSEARVPDSLVRRLLVAGAHGRFDHHFRALGKRLVDLGVPDAVIVLGWEMNGSTYTHRCAPHPAAWRKYWRRIVTTMREVPGAEFRFDFSPARGADAIPWDRCYPGDDVVDIIGMDTYDQPPGNDFDDYVTQPYGLRDHVNFATEHDKPISFPEWGLFRNGDNPAYVRRMVAWIEEHRPVYHTISDYCPHGVWRCPRNPAAARAFWEAFAARAPREEREEHEEDWVVPLPDPVPDPITGLWPGA